MSGAVGGVAIGDGDDPRHLWRWCLGACLLAGAIFLAFPQIDLWISKSFYSATSGFIGKRYAWVEWLRSAFVVFYFACLIGSIVGWLATLKTKQALLGVDTLQWLFLVLCLSIGPGLLANLVFKDQWGRARPKHVIEFGGSKHFTAAPLPAKECKRGCSFVSGEAASAFVPFYAAAALIPQWGAALIVGGTISGLIAGFVRISQGAHFLSDIVFAGLLMALMVLVLKKFLRPAALTLPLPTSAKRSQLPNR
jgi:lipid A 4'-phosphatase